MNNVERNILVVGGSSAARSGLEADLKKSHPSWRTAFSPSAREALAALGQSRFDAVVADDTLPDMDGFALLGSVQERQPDAHRVVVCELNDPKVAAKTTRMAHHCVPKPWEGMAVRGVLQRAFELSYWLSNPAVRRLVERLPVLPSPPSLYFEIVRALRSDDADLEVIFRRVGRDPALTAKLLQMANSAVLGLRHKVTTVQDAISYLGLETTRSLVLLAHTFSYCDKASAAGFSIEGLWRHSLAVGAMARRIAQREKAAGETADECFLTGLLHDIGQLLLAVNLPDDYSKVIARVRQSGPNGTPPGSALPLWQAETEAFGANHAEVGAELMAMWNLPLTVVEGIALHHHPARMLSQAFSPLAAVHATEALAFQFSGGSDPLGYAAIDLNFLGDLGLAASLDGWRETCRREFQGRTEGED